CPSTTTAISWSISSSAVRGRRRVWRRRRASRACANEQAHARFGSERAPGAAGAAEGAATASAGRARRALLDHPPAPHGVSADPRHLARRAVGARAGSVRAGGQDRSRARAAGRRARAGAGRGGVGESGGGGGERAEDGGEVPRVRRGGRGPGSVARKRL